MTRRDKPSPNARAAWVTGNCARCGEQWWIVEKQLRKLEEANRPVYCSQSCERTARRRKPKGEKETP
jgi:hypothetical protein